MVLCLIQSRGYTSSDTAIPIKCIRPIVQYGIENTNLNLISIIKMHSVYEYEIGTTLESNVPFHQVILLHDTNELYTKC